MYLDPKVTEKIEKWLAMPAADRDIKAGADLLLSLNNNRILHNSIIKRAWMEKLEYELQKHLNIRRHGHNNQSLLILNKQVVKAVGETVENALVISTEDDHTGVAKVAKGMRSDHDALPKEIKELWDRNIELYHKIKFYYNQLLQMQDAAPCDRAELLFMLSESDKLYRQRLKAYDEYKAGDSIPDIAKKEPTVKPRRRRKKDETAG